MTTRKARNILRSIGMGISDKGFASTVCGGYLMNGKDAPAWLSSLNGFSCEATANEIIKRSGVTEHWDTKEICRLALES